MVGMYLVGSAVLGYLISAVRDLLSRRESNGAEKLRDGAEAVG
jgi:hypothetical protein